MRISFYSIPKSIRNHIWISGLTSLFTWVLFISLLSCKDSSSKENYEPGFSSDSSSGKVLTFGVPSLVYYDAINIVTKYLNKNFDEVQFKPVACITFDDYLDKLSKNYFNLTIINGKQAMDAEKNGYTIVAKMGNDENYKAVIFVRKDSAINSLSDLIGKTMSFAGATTLVGTMMPLYYLYKKGIDVNKDIKLVYVTSFESAIMNVYMGKCTAGTAWLTAWENFAKSRPEITSSLEIKWVTPQLLNPPLLIRNDLKKEISEKVTRLILELHNDEEGKKALDLLSISKFEKANSDTYKPLKDFLKDYEAVIH